ncbi:MAG: RHS repeat-associated core domain-containing protein, partial [Candidatus Binatia bacterium]
DPNVGFLFFYTSRYVDPDTGLQYNWHRWYHARIRRWLNQDPKGFAAGDVNLYRYVGNSPTNYTDPTGLDAGITGEGTHTGIAVELRGLHGEVIAVLVADFRSANLGNEGSCDFYLHDPGEISIAVVYGPVAVTRKIPGGHQQDVRLRNWILRQAGGHIDLLAILMAQPGVRRLPGKGKYDTYSVYYRNCNRFTEEALDAYVGFDWQPGFTVLTGDDLIALWDWNSPDWARPPGEGRRSTIGPPRLEDVDGAEQ